jgi:nitroimidazol reductase NimA-like FMN-containing flavoprotein (pyridoxamine 5'-phosphate oxidase superfamily)
MEPLVASDIARLLANEPVAHVAVVADGDPYVTPVSFVWDDDALWFRTMPGRRLDAMASHPRVSCEVSRFHVETGYWESVVIDGAAETVTDAAIEADMMAAIRAKYRRITRMALDLPPDILPNVGVVIKVVPDHVSGRGSGRGIDGPSLPGALG